ncbi:LegC family aminotransferase [Rubritalea sp.]|uniref:LegC family aminotransferase n=1 Tax=Rubritalea sp. TaxID=2109375 RepID=UPI003EF843C0
MNPSEELIGVLTNVLGAQHGVIPLHEPCFRGAEAELVADCIKSGWVSSVGKYVDQFEEDLAAYCGVERAVAVVNGTAALHVCLILAGVKPNDEVLMPSLTFVATANAVGMAGAIPHFVDVERATLGLDPDSLYEYLKNVSVKKVDGLYNKNTGRRITAILPMHTLGHAIRMDRLMEVAELFSLAVVEDAAESLGSYYKGKHTGNFGIASAISFNGNKIITTGGGGAILTNDNDLADRAKHLTTTAKVPHPWEFVHDQKAFNYRMPNLNAAMGVAQLEQMPDFLESKRKLASRYKAAIENAASFRWVDEPLGCKSNYWLNAVELVNASRKDRDSLLSLCNDHGFMARPLWRPMHQLEIYKDCPRSKTDVSESIEKSILCLPSSASLIKCS